MKMLSLIYKIAAGDIIGSPSAVPGYVQPGQAAAKIAGFFNIFLIFIAIAATFFFIRGGLDFIMSGGDPSKVKTGMAAIQYSIIGLIVAAIGFIVLGIVRNALGITSLNLGV